VNEDTHQEKLISLDLIIIFKIFQNWTTRHTLSEEKKISGIHFLICWLV
jgi:hypothetical protein